ncbi:MAG: CoA transferase [Caulobacteraceae bacterium]|nr:CoA transferase [Caulobacteraceae bacterium]
MGVLDGVRVLDFGRYIAGPYCAALLAEFGAEVIRIDKRDGSEDRFVTPLGPGLEGALFTQMNRGKRSITLDPTSDKGREVVRRLAATADIVVANLPPQTMQAMGLDYESLRAVRADIILVAPSAFGQVGPLRDQVGFDGIGQAMSGAVHLTGLPDQPYRAAVSWVDFGTALHSALGAVLALMERRRTGQGQQVSTSLLGTALSFMSPTLIEQAVLAPNRQPLGNRGFGSAPADLFRTKSGWILIQVVGQPLFRRVAKLVDEPGWLEDPRFATDLSRGEHGELISARVAEWCAARGRDEALAALAEARIPAGPVLSPAETLGHAHVQAMGLLQEVRAAGAPRATPVFGVPIGLSATPGAVGGPPPHVGEHTDDVLGSVGYGEAELSGLRAAGVI